MTAHHRSFTCCTVLLAAFLPAAMLPAPARAEREGPFGQGVAPAGLSRETPRTPEDAGTSEGPLRLVAQAPGGAMAPAAPPQASSLLGRRPLRQGSWEAGALAAFSLSGAGGPSARPTVQAYWLLPRIGYTFWEIPWYPASFQIYLEPAVAYITHPAKTYLLGVNAILRHTFTVWQRVSPYIEGGAGLLNTNLRHRALDETIEFMPQVGAGFHLHVFERVSLNAGYRWHHISNAGLGDRNLGLNSHFPYVGFTYFF